MKRSEKSRNEIKKQIRKEILITLMLSLSLQGSGQALAGGWTFDKETEIWTYHESETPTNCIEDLKKGWHQDIYDGYRYYFDLQSGHMLYGWHTIDGYSYYFTDIRNRENYFEQEDGFWYYRENGLVPFGALVERPAESDSGETNQSEKTEKQDEGNVTEPEIPAPPESSGSEGEESKVPDFPEGTESELPDTPEETEPVMPEEELRPCIEIDSWEVILSQPTAYHDCIEEHCEKELLVRGYRVTEENNRLVATDSCTEAVMVSVAGIETDGADTATFIMTEACSAFTMPMSESPYYCNTREEIFDARSTGGWKESVIYKALNGGIFSYRQGLHEMRETDFTGFTLLYEAENGKQKKLRPLQVEKPSGNGFLFESIASKEGYGDPFNGYGKEMVKSGLWLLSEAELLGENGNSISGEGMQYPDLAQPAETYWLRSSATCGEEGYFVTSDGNEELASIELPLRFGFVIR